MSPPPSRADHEPVGTGAKLDLDLHGFASVRLLDPTERDADVVTRQLGLREGHVEGRPDISIRFVERVDGEAALTFVGEEDAGFSDDRFVVLHGRHKTRVRLVLPLDRLGAGLEIEAERGATAVPLLVSLLNVVALSKGVLPLHAAAFEYDGVGAVVTGWSGGGKSDALLGCVRRGASYVADDWVYVPEDGRRAFGLPEPVRLWDRQLGGPYRDALRWRERLRLSFVRTVRRTAQLLPASDGFRKRVDALLGRQLAVEIPPQRLFGPDGIVPSCGFDILFLVAPHDSAVVSVEPVDGLEVAVRMTYSLQYERRELYETYEKFRFSFPTRACPALERTDEIERRLLRRTLSGKSAFLVRHPLPTDGEALADAILGCCRQL